MIKKKQYSSYKDCGIGWIGKIPETWEINKIKNLFDFSKGLNITKKDLTETGIPVISYGQIHAKFNDGIHIKDELIRHTDKTKAKTNSKVSKGDFIFADTSEDLDGCGNSIYVNKDMLLYGGYHDVILKSKINRDNTYLAYLFQSNKWRSQIRSKVSGVKVYSINQSILKECYILLPNTNEQEQIAKYLDNKTQKIEQNITKNKQLITLLKEKRTALINQTVTKGVNPDTPMKESGIEWIGKIPEHWDIKTFKNVNQFNPSVNINSLDENSTITYTPMENIKKGEFINNFAKLKDIPNNLTRYEEGDIVLAKVTPCFENGNLAIMDNLYSGHGFGSSELFVIRPEEIFKKFIFYWLQSETFIQKTCSTMHGVAGLQRIDANFVRNSKVPFPDLIEQKEISNYLDKKTSQIDKTIEKIEKNIELLEEYKESLIHHVVTGKIDVRGVEV